jgi:uncharacterized protein
MTVAERTCCGCFHKKPKADLIGVTLLKDGQIVVNKDGKIAGRTAYLCDSVKCLVRARDRKGKSGPEYALKTKIPDQIWRELEKIIIKP